MRFRMTKAASIVGLMCVGAAPALADHDVFLGWSTDGSYFVKLGQKRKKDLSLSFCSEDPKTALPNEVAKAPREPILGSPGPCANFELDESPPITVQQAKQLVKGRPSRRGPKGETISIKLKDKGGDDLVVVAVMKS